MSYAVVQDSIEVPDQERLKRAFRAVPTLTAVDAQILGRDAFGILVKVHTAEEANTLVGALRSEGVGAEAVPEKQLPELPPTKFVKHLSCDAEALTIFDSIDRVCRVEWAHVMLIAAGNVRLTEFNDVWRDHFLSSTGEVFHSNRDMLGNRTDFYNKEPKRETRGERHPRLLLEIVLTGAVQRYSVKADESAVRLFEYLGDRRTGQLAGDFALLVRDLMQFAPHAVPNRGAYLLRNGQPTFDYPSKNAFQEEIIWLLCRMAKAGKL
ncbi:MAG: hypothetical protein AB1705_14480 [Verrucomicrobiota bacterium]